MAINKSCSNPGNVKSIFKPFNALFKCVWGGGERGFRNIKKDISGRYNVHDLYRVINLTVYKSNNYLTG